MASQRQVPWAPSALPQLPALMLGLSGTLSPCFRQVLANKLTVRSNGDWVLPFWREVRP